MIDFVVIRCRVCGHPMTKEVAWNKAKNGKPISVWQWRCTNSDCNHVSKPFKEAR